MRPLTFSINKHFIPVANKPLIFYPIEVVADAGIKDFGITYNPGYLDEVKALLGDGSRWGINISYILQEQPIGLANIIQVAEEFLGGEPFVLHLGDNIFVDGIKEMVDYFQTHQPNGLVSMIHHKENRRMGVPYFNEHGRLIQYIEKPENPPHDFAVPGIYFADRNFFNCFKGADQIKPSPRGEFEIPTAFQWLIDHNFRVDVIEYKGKWLDPGKFDDWMEANQYLLDTKLTSRVDSEIDPNSVLENRVRIGKDCRIENSRVRGPVIIGDNVTIKDSFIGPFTSISNECFIEGSHIENSVLMEKVKVVNIEKTIDQSLIGTESEILKSNGPNSSAHLFVGQKCQINL